MASSVSTQRSDVDTQFWRWTGLFGLGHVTYAPGVLEAEGPFTNPARMIEDIMGHNPTRGEAGGHWDDKSDSDFWAGVWTHAGWWDEPWR